ncbi:MAG: Long-chain-fatty-acid--CoA ligase FadD15 [Syntrophaceae bacterium PtaU1.Bin231]|nr:MAG: Long-chain-fatty-acid--CoA ligase FadD15 [Syntrophaceae bacterium PtaU1.Bin231]
MTDIHAAPLETLTLPQVLLRQAARLKNRPLPALREKAYGVWQAYSWEEYLGYVRRTALGFQELGLKRGEIVGLVVNNHPEWLFCELGVQSLGGVTVNLFTSSITEELRTAVSRFRAAYVVAQDQEQVDKLLDARGKLPHVRKVVYIDPTGMSSYEDHPWLIRFSELQERGRAGEERSDGRFEAEVAKGRREDTALMILTSGTTGVPKLAMISHRNFVEMGVRWREALAISEGENWLSMSPPAWIVDQMWGLGVALAAGMTMNFPETPETVAEDFREIGPSLVITASRFWEEMASRIRVKMSDAGWIKKRLFDLGERLGKSVVAMQSRGEAIPPWMSWLQVLFRRLVYLPLLDRMGCTRLRSAFTGGHPISPDVIHFFRAVGLNLKQCYGLTEAGGIFQIQPDDQVKPETVGKPLPGIEVKLADDEEVILSSPTAFQGYYQDFQATESAFREGWLRTGDAGYFDKDGQLVIIGRKEEIIRNKSGHAFSPDFIETRLKFSPYVKEVVVFGEGRPYITALVNIDMGNVGSWAEERLIPYTTYADLSQLQPVEQLILGEVVKVNEQLPDLMKIRKFILLYKLLDADDEELTRTGKVRRRFVYGLYIKLIEAMYRNETQVDVKGKIRYRDGRVGTIETQVRVIPVG